MSVGSGSSGGPPLVSAPGARGAHVESGAPVPPVPPALVLGIALLAVSTGAGRTFEYLSHATADEGGRWTLRVPYAATPDTPYVVKGAALSARVAVGEEAVLSGHTIEVQTNSD